MRLFKVTFWNGHGGPQRIFYVREETTKGAFQVAKAIELILERRTRDRTLEETFVDAVTGEDEDHLEG